MSRCFPFPPPGYERKLVVEDGDLIAKEKKHKKDKDKEKKEDKEKDQERSKERHKDKEKKEKHKHKDKDKKKEKKRSRDEKRSRGQSLNVEKVGSNSPQSIQLTRSSSVQELGRRIADDDCATGNLTAGNINDTYQGRGELLDNVAKGYKGCWSEGKTGFGQKANRQIDNSQTRFLKVSNVYNLSGVEQRTEIIRSIEKANGKPTEGKEKQKRHRSDKGDIDKDKDGKIFEVQAESREKFGHHGMQIDPPKEAAFVQELGRRIRDENGATSSQVIAKPNATSQKRVESIGKVANGGNVSYSFHAKDTLNFGNGINRMENGQRENESRGPKVAIVHNFKGLEQGGCGSVRPVVPFEGTGRNGFGGTGAVSDQEKKIYAKDEGRNKARVEEKAKQGGDHIIKLSSLGESGSDSTDRYKKVSNKTVEGVTNKRKEPETNGHFDDNDVQPNKLRKIVLSPQPTTGNGKKLQGSTTITLSTSKQGTANSLKVDSKEHKVNGKLGAEGSSFGLTKPSPATAKANGLMVAKESPLGSTKPPSVTAKANGMMVDQELPLGSTIPPLASVKAKGMIDAQFRSRKPPFPFAKVDGMMVDQKSPIGSTKPTLDSVKGDGMMVNQESPIGSTKPTLVSVKANGTIGAPAPPLGSTKEPTAKPKHKDKGKSKSKSKSSSKPPSPHPDTKYLSQILCIPKMDELPEFDDQDWLFDNNSFPSKETKLKSMTDEEQPQVWAKAVHIEPADVYALPYVIPY